MSCGGEDRGAGKQRGLEGKGVGDVSWMSVGEPAGQHAADACSEDEGCHGDNRNEDRESAGVSDSEAALDHVAGHGGGEDVSEAEIADGIDDPGREGQSEQDERQRMAEVRPRLLVEHRDMQLLAVHGESGDTLTEAESPMVAVSVEMERVDRRDVPILAVLLMRVPVELINGAARVRKACPRDDRLRCNAAIGRLCVSSMTMARLWDHWRCPF